MIFDSTREKKELRAVEAEIHRITPTDVEEWLNKKWNSPRCTACNSNEWVIDTSAYEITSSLSNRCIPVIVISCRNCGSILLVNKTIIARSKLNLK